MGIYRIKQISCIAGCIYLLKRGFGKIVLRIRWYFHFLFLFVFIKNSNIVIEKGTDEYTARVVEAKDVLDGDTYKVTNYLTDEAKLQHALRNAVIKLSKRLSEQTKPEKIRRKPFPGRQTLDING